MAELISFSILLTTFSLFGILHIWGFLAATSLISPIIFSDCSLLSISLALLFVLDLVVIGYEPNHFTPCSLPFIPNNLGETSNLSCSC